jgi:hypothetical protein
MSEPTLRELERDVEATRAKLARDLSTLRSPSTLSEFSEEVKQEAIGTKDALLEHAKSSAQSFLDDLKARAAANPAAALVVGAGIAWRLFKHPPIATALVGAGLYSLWQAKPGPVRGRSNSEYFEEAKENLQGQASELASAAKDKASELANSAKDKATELASRATEQARGFASMAGDQVEDMATKAANQATRLAHDARDTAREWRSSAAGEVRQMSALAADAASGTADRILQGARDAASNVQARTTNLAIASSQDGRDKLLLGVAGLAVAAAVGMAYQRRTEEER